MSNKEMFEEHNYIEFIKDIIRQGHEIQWDERKATIKLHSGYTILCNFSYNESKIWFTLAEKSFRILDNGELAAECIEKLDAIMEQMGTLLYNYEG